jgi:programmed cell death 8 (apoptosis-inducing factor)
MTGAHKPYWHQSMFWSDLGPKIGFEAIGLIDSELQTVAVYAKGKPDDEEKKEDSEGNREQKDVTSTASANELKHKIPETKTPTTTTNENKDDYSKGVVFYLKENKVVGIVLWNVFNRIPIARKVKNKCNKLILKNYLYIFCLDNQRSRSYYKFSRTCETF